MFHDEQKVHSTIARSLHCVNFGSNAGGVHKRRACYSISRSTQELRRACYSLSRSTQELQDLQCCKVTMLLCYKFNQNFPSIACIATVELVYDLSFLKLLLLIVDGDVESNPGPSNTPTGKQKGRKTKKTTFNFARKRLDMDGVKINENSQLLVELKSEKIIMIVSPQITRKRL